MYEQTTENFSGLGEVVIARTDISRSGFFAFDLFTSGRPHINVHVVQPGFVALRMEHKEPLSAFLLTERANTTFARAELARMVHNLANEAALNDLVPEDAKARLSRLAEGVPRRGRSNIDTAAQATDPVVGVNLRMAAERAKLAREAADDEEHPYRPFWQLEAEYYRLLKS